MNVARCLKSIYRSWRLGNVLGDMLQAESSAYRFVLLDTVHNKRRAVLEDPNKLSADVPEMATTLMKVCDQLEW
jgi:hypothetical protein